MEEPYSIWNPAAAAVVVVAVPAAAAAVAAAAAAVTATADLATRRTVEALYLLLAQATRRVQAEL